MSEEKKEYKIVDFPLEMGIAIQTPEGKNISQMELLVDIANKVDMLLEAIK